MTMTQDHVRTFEKARDQLLAQRRSLAEALAGGYKKGRTENQIERIVKVQAAIDVIASAIDQDRLASPRAGASEPAPDDRWR
jgi:hypothetical protein